MHLKGNMYKEKILGNTSNSIKKGEVYEKDNKKAIISIFFAINFRKFITWKGRLFGQSALFLEILLNYT